MMAWIANLPSGGKMSLVFELPAVCRQAALIAMS